MVPPTSGVGLPRPIVMNSAGWLLTEVGRQPGSSRPDADQERRLAQHHHLDIAISLTVFVLIYAVLGVAEGVLMVRFAAATSNPSSRHHEGGGPSEAHPRR